MYDIVCFGSAAVDTFVETEKQKIAREGGVNFFAYQSGEKILISDLHMDVGGGGTNTSTACSRLGLQAGYCGLLGKDANAEMVLKTLAREGVSFLGGATNNFQTNSSIVLDSKLIKDRTILVYKGASEHLEPVHVRPFEASWIYTSSLSSSSFKTVLAIIEVMEATGTKIAANPSSYQIEHDKENVHTLLAKASIVVLNREEAKLLVGEADDKTLLARLRALGPRTAIVTAGGDGAFLATEGLFLHGKPSPKRVVHETTGAGDCFASTFVAATILGKPPREALRWALVNVESLIGTVGAKRGLLSREELETRLSKDEREILEL